MKKIIAILSILFISTLMFGQKKYVDVKTVDTNCTIIKPIVGAVIPQHNIDGVFNETADVKAKIEWTPLSSGGICTVSIILNGEEGPAIDKWIDATSGIKLYRLKDSNGHYTYTLGNDDFFFFGLLYTYEGQIIDGQPEGYILDTTTREVD